jgi:hypothetical protein
MAHEALGWGDEAEPPPDAGYLAVPGEVARYWFAEGVGAERVRVADAFIDAMIAGRGARPQPASPMRDIDAIQASAEKARALATGDALAEPDAPSPGGRRSRAHTLMEARVKVVFDGDGGLPAALLALPDGQTVFDLVAGALTDAYSTGHMPRLTAGAGGAAVEAVLEDPADKPAGKPRRGGS